MVCPKCGREINIDNDTCPKCGALIKAEKRKSFVVSIPDSDDLPSEGEQNDTVVAPVEEEKDEANSDAEVTNFVEDTAKEKKIDAIDNDKKVDINKEEETNTVDIDDTEQKIDTTDSVLHQADAILNGAVSDDEKSTDESVAENAIHSTSKKPASRQHNVNVRQRRSNKRIYLAVKLLSVFCAVIIVSLTFISKQTGIFENDPGKTVTLTKLTDEQLSAFEAKVNRLSALFDSGYSSDTAILDELLHAMHPDTESGLYAGFFDKKSALTNADPANRYKTSDDSGKYNYTKVSKEEIEQIAKFLSLQSWHDANTDEYYYYDGEYYFAPSIDEKTEKQVFFADKANALQTGEYYISGSVYPEGTTSNEDGTYSKAANGELYFIAVNEKIDSSDDWTIKQISTEPIIDENGENSQGDINKTEPTYKMHREEIDAKTSIGKLYAKYIVEYPVFDEQGPARAAIDGIYNEIIEKYKSDAKNADSAYKKAKDKGINDEDLPYYIHISAAVVYNAEGRLALLETTAKYEPTSIKDEESSSAAGQSESSEAEAVPAVKLSQIAYEGYTLELQSGNFVQKDDLLGKNYAEIQKSLYENYYRQIHSSNIDGQEIEIPTDRDGLGEKIYSSAWAQTSKDMVTFYFTDDSGAGQSVSINVNGK